MEIAQVFGIPPWKAQPQRWIRVRSRLIDGPAARHYGYWDVEVLDNPKVQMWPDNLVFDASRESLPSCSEAASVTACQSEPVVNRWAKYILMKPGVYAFEDFVTTIPHCERLMFKKG